MFRRSIEWFLGSVVVYILTAACAATGGIDGMVEMATGGLAAMVGGTQGSGAEGSDGQGAESSGAQASDGEGADNSDGEGATGGVSIIDPVPDADAAEDGTRIVNLYRTTADGLKTAEGYWDKDLGFRCSFQKKADGKDYCVPLFDAYTTYFLDDQCTSPVFLVTCNGTRPSTGGVYAAADGSCGVAEYRPYTVGNEVPVPSSIYTGSVGGTCTSTTVPEGTTLFAATAPIPLQNLAEGTLVQGEP